MTKIAIILLLLAGLCFDLAIREANAQQLSPELRQCNARIAAVAEQRNAQADQTAVLMAELRRLTEELAEAKKAKEKDEKK